jgi:hypothetical protein
MKAALARWHAPAAAEKIAELILRTITQPADLAAGAATLAAHPETKPRASLVTSTLA